MTTAGCEGAGLSWALRNADAWQEVDVVAMCAGRAAAVAEAGAGAVYAAQKMAAGVGEVGGACTGVVAWAGEELVPEVHTAVGSLQ